LADSGTLARATIVKVTSTAAGQNIACMGELSAYYVDYFGSTSLVSNTQMDQAVVRTYYARNTGAFQTLLSRFMKPYTYTDF
jgi:hypothetical protein